MNYRHGYHAGSFADVFKHLVLIELIQCLKYKEKPFCYLDTHAGSGIYPMQEHLRKKPHESSTGIAKIGNALDTDTPQIIQEYMNIIQSYEYPQYYPGSPFIAKHLLRENDRLILIELHPEEHNLLRRNLSFDPRIAIHHQNGFQSLKAYLPPKEKRGLILMDPAFEQKEDWEQMITAVKEGLKKFPMGVYALWYPLKDERAVKKFLNALYALNHQAILELDLSIYPKDSPLSLYGCGLCVINAPWKFQEKCRTWLPWLWKTLSVSGAGRYYIGSL